MARRSWPPVPSFEQPPARTVVVEGVGELFRRDGGGGGPRSARRQTLRRGAGRCLSACRGRCCGVRLELDARSQSHLRVIDGLAFEGLAHHFRGSKQGGGILLLDPKVGQEVARKDRLRLLARQVECATPRPGESQVPTNPILHPQLILKDWG